MCIHILGYYLLCTLMWNEAAAVKGQSDGRKLFNTSKHLLNFLILNWVMCISCKIFWEKLSYSNIRIWLQVASCEQMNSTCIWLHFNNVILSVQNQITLRKLFCMPLIHNLFYIFCTSLVIIYTFITDFAMHVIILLHSFHYTSLTLHTVLLWYLALYLHTAKGGITRSSFCSTIFLKVKNKIPFLKKANNKLNC